MIAVIVFNRWNMLLVSVFVSLQSASRKLLFKSWDNCFSSLYCFFVKIEKVGDGLFIVTNLLLLIILLSFIDYFGWFLFWWLREGLVCQGKGVLLSSYLQLIFVLCSQGKVYKRIRNSNSENASDEGILWQCHHFREREIQLQGGIHKKLSVRTTGMPLQS